MIMVIFSDIHGNIYSLEKALKEMEKYKPEQYLFLGDMVGYYYYQNECINLLANLSNLISIKGNHDDNFLKYFLDENTLKKFDQKYGKSYSMLKNNITKNSFEYLKNMQDFEKNEIYEAYHASPSNFFSEYIYPDNKTLVLNNIDALYLFLGHTHYQMDKQICGTRVINPGSIGQPRDTNKPSFVVIDTKENQVEFVRFDYDTKPLIFDILRNQDNDYLISVLERKST